MVLIITSFGATKNYPDRSMMRKTLGAFLNSLKRQTDKNFTLFISHHDKPEIDGIDEPWIRWCSVACDEDYESTLIPSWYPETLSDGIEYKKVSYESKIMDMGRKTYHSTIQAGLWAHKNKLNSFWMLRMDSDDLLGKDVVERINDQDPRQVSAIYNRRCHIFDPRLKQIGRYEYRYPTTCNALHMRIEGDRLKHWFYHCDDHTRFVNRVQKDGIACREMDWNLCILANTGNSISGRGEIEQNTEAKITKISLTEEWVDRYGLDYLNRMDG